MIETVSQDTPHPLGASKILTKKTSFGGKTWVVKRINHQKLINLGGATSIQLLIFLAGKIKVLLGKDLPTLKIKHQQPESRDVAAPPSTCLPTAPALAPQNQEMFLLNNANVVHRVVSAIPQ